jgi:ATP-binding cassette subfamily F protein 3
MSSYDIAEKIRESLPGTEEILVQYLSGYLVDDASDDEDILQVARYILESLTMDKPDVLEQLMASLTALLQDQLIRRENPRSGPKLQRLDKVLDMSKTGAMSNTIAFSEGVDLESINKGKCVYNICCVVSLCLTCCTGRASRVDVKKLEKQEAKLKAKIEKRARRDLYEGSKLLEQTKKQVRLQSLPLLTYQYLFQAILRRDVYESASSTLSYHRCLSIMDYPR